MCVHLLNHSGEILPWLDGGILSRRNGEGTEPRNTWRSFGICQGPYIATPILRDFRLRVRFGHDPLRKYICLVEQTLKRTANCWGREERWPQPTLGVWAYTFPRTGLTADCPSKSPPIDFLEMEQTFGQLLYEWVNVQQERDQFKDQTEEEWQE